MNKKFKVLCLGLLVFCLSGCVKMEYSIGIHEDGSMNISIIEAVSKEFVDSMGEGSMNSLDLKELESQGFYIQSYDDGEMTGHKVEKSFGNINHFSSEGIVETDLELDSFGKDNFYLFQVKKGFLKNTYIAKIKISGLEDLENFTIPPYGEGNTDFSGSMSGSDFEMEFGTNGEDWDYEISGAGTDLDEFGNLAASQLMANMELNFSVSLPYKAISHNATNTSRGGKTLTWDLKNIKDSIQFEFSLYNRTNLYITLGMGMIILIVAVILIKNMIGGKKKTKGGFPSNYNHVYQNSVNGDISNSTGSSSMGVTNTQNFIPSDNANSLISSNEVPTSMNSIPNSQPVSNTQGTVSNDYQYFGTSTVNTTTSQNTSFPNFTNNMDFESTTTNANMNIQSNENGRMQDFNSNTDQDSTISTPSSSSFQSNHLLSTDLDGVNHNQNNNINPPSNSLF